MKRTGERRKGEMARLEMTPMIDVVFLLLIFFIVALKPEDLMARLNVSVPSGEHPPETPVEIELVDILIYKDGFVLKGRPISLEELDSRLKRLASFSTQISITLKCAEDSPHQFLIQILDVCAKHKLNHLSVFRM